MTAGCIAVTDAALLDWLASDRPLLDVRAPAEFASGALPSATNLPLLGDDERAAVGTCYKRNGSAAAIALGHQLVAGPVRAARIAAWCAYLDEHPDALLFCWRGGMRSQLVQEWLAESGADIARIEGGFKTLRTHAIGLLGAGWDQTLGPALGALFVLGGRTGSGKTVLLAEFAAAIDLEALADHRGSAFGGRSAPQPSQVDFEHALLRALARRARAGGSATLMEDESRMIGRATLPEPLHQHMRRAEVVVLEVPRAERATHIAREYVHEAIAEASLTDGDVDAARQRVRLQLRGALDRILRRLGGARHQVITCELDAAFASSASSDQHTHLEWISSLLEHYYDPMYDYQLGRRAERVVFRGDRAAVRGFLRERLG